MNMRRLLTVLLLLAAMLLTTACAGEDSWVGLPSEIFVYFTSGKGAGSTLVGSAELRDHGSDNCWFVLAQDARGTNTLYSFKQKKGTWQKDFQTSAAVPQTKNRMWMAIGLEGTYELYNAKPSTTPHLCIGYLDDQEDHLVFWTIYALEKGQWNLHDIHGYTGGYQAMIVKNNSITYYADAEFTRLTGTVRGSIQRDIRYLSLSSVPKTYEKARATLTEAPTLPDSDCLFAEEIKFTGGKKYTVYSAPDKNALRGGKGKAAVSTNGWIQVFGEEDGFVLVQYSIDAGHYRFGYISAAALPKNASVDALRWNAQSVRTKTATTVTDDPLYSNSSLASLPKDAPVTWLATLGDWAYIESDAGELLRGFVPVSALNADREMTAACAEPVQIGPNAWSYLLDAGIEYSEDLRVRHASLTQTRDSTTLGDSVSVSVSVEYPTEALPLDTIDHWDVCVNGEAVMSAGILTIFDQQRRVTFGAEAPYSGVITGIELIPFLRNGNPVDGLTVRLYGEG